MKHPNLKQTQERLTPEEDAVITGHFLVVSTSFPFTNNKEAKLH